MFVVPPLGVLFGWSEFAHGLLWVWVILAAILFCLAFGWCLLASTLYTSFRRCGALTLSLRRSRSTVVTVSFYRCDVVMLLLMVALLAEVGGFGGRP